MWAARDARAHKIDPRRALDTGAACARGDDGLRVRRLLRLRRPHHDRLPAALRRRSGGFGGRSRRKVDQGELLVSPVRELAEGSPPLDLGTDVAGLALE